VLAGGCIVVSSREASLCTAKRDAGDHVINGPVLGKSSDDFDQRPVASPPGRRLTTESADLALRPAHGPRCKMMLRLRCESHRL